MTARRRRIRQTLRRIRWYTAGPLGCVESEGLAGLLSGSTLPSGLAVTQAPADPLVPSSSGVASAHARPLDSVASNRVQLSPFAPGADGATPTQEVDRRAQLKPDPVNAARGR